jgi:Remorin, C-terminal region
LKNKLAKIHKEAEMKRAHVEAQRGKAFVEAEEKAAKYQATGVIPNKKAWCCGTST